MASNEVDLGAYLKYEEVQFFFRKHWIHFLRILFFGLLVGFLIFVVLLGFYGLINAFSIQVLRPFFVFIAIIGSFIYLNMFFLQIINYFFDVVIITDARIVIARKTVFLKDDSATIDLTKIQDISAKSWGIFRNYLHFGELIITLSASIPPVVIHAVPNPHYRLEQCNRVKREHILKRQERRVRYPDNVSEPLAKGDNYLKDIRFLN
ncbi:hypothetical protein COY07_03895 [Candidatus Peregrinibacteria bacterium CG_4_10_14_0_2_um_filter_43_11]|nr:MAG: hypothetical protein COY07_03895 [Candidatus Peregrinibacteria bacterium CG_4_10_14_0_2_um_filter_43_11]